MAHGQRTKYSGGCLTDLTIVAKAAPHRLHARLQDLSLRESSGEMTQLKAAYFPHQFHSLLHSNLP
jgi:hypothetical protein